VKNGLGQSFGEYAGNDRLATVSRKISFSSIETKNKDKIPSNVDAAAYEN